MAVFGTNLIEYLQYLARYTVEIEALMDYGGAFRNKEEVINLLFERAINLDMRKSAETTFKNLKSVGILRYVAHRTLLLDPELMVFLKGLRMALGMVSPQVIEFHVKELRKLYDRLLIAQKQFFSAASNLGELSEIADIFQEMLGSSLRILAMVDQNSAHVFQKVSEYQALDENEIRLESNIDRIIDLQKTTIGPIVLIVNRQSSFKHISQAIETNIHEVFIAEHGSLSQVDSLVEKAESLVHIIHKQSLTAAHLALQSEAALRPLYEQAIRRKKRRSRIASGVANGLHALQEGKLDLWDLDGFLPKKIAKKERIITTGSILAAAREFYSYIPPIQSAVDLTAHKVTNSKPEFSLKSFWKAIEKEEHLVDVSLFLQNNGFPAEAILRILTELKRLPESKRLGVEFECQTHKTYQLIGPSRFYFPKVRYLNPNI